MNSEIIKDIISDNLPLLTDMFHNLANLQAYQWQRDI